jgi:hypothetical protein
MHRQSASGGEQGGDVQPQPLPAPDGADTRSGEDVHALALHREDEVVQQLAVAKYALTIGDMARAMAAIDAALATARRSLTQLLAVVGTVPSPARPLQPVRADALPPTRSWPSLAAPPRPRLAGDEAPDHEPAVTAARSSRDEDSSLDVAPAASAVDPLAGWPSTG